MIVVVVINGVNLLTIRDTTLPKSKENAELFQLHPKEATPRRKFDADFKSDVSQTCRDLNIDPLSRW